MAASPPDPRETWPRWATEPVALVASDPSWGHVGAALAAEVGVALAPVGVQRVHHVGSTAVPGLGAKPIVDLLAEVDRSEVVAERTALDAVAEEALARLEADVWHLVPPELDGRPWRRLLVLVRAEHRAAHLQLVVAGHPRVHDTLAFRDALRADRGTARRYGALKLELATAHADDREAYTEAKATFVRDVLRQVALAGDP
jgi:GrpB-like predicted nucleotidyltransferase (UPF0157 family)